LPANEVNNGYSLTCGFEQPHCQNFFETAAMYVFPAHNPAANHHAMAHIYHIF